MLSAENVTGGEKHPPPPVPLGLREVKERFVLLNTVFSYWLITEIYQGLIEEYGRSIQEWQMYSQDSFILYSTRL